MKPLSVFGVVHLFQKKQIRNACTVKYPRLVDDLKTGPNDRGLLAFVSDQLLEVDFLGKTKEEGTGLGNLDREPSTSVDVENRPDPGGEVSILQHNQTSQTAPTLPPLLDIPPLAVSPPPPVSP